MRTPFALLLLSLYFYSVPAAVGPDILIADFEGGDYGLWKVEGEAFGPAPARGTLPHQMPVSGFEGKALVNTFFNGDGATGTLTSPPLKIERHYINFLLGGGGDPEKTCINLLIDGEIVRTATGPNTAPGGTEALDWHSWEVSDLAGKDATIQIVDRATGGWGHINVDQIVQSDRKIANVTLARELKIDKPYLHLPVKGGAAKRRMRFVVDGSMVRQFDIELAEDGPDFWTYTETAPYRDKLLRIEVDRMRAESDALERIRLADTLPGEDLYQEPLRPQFHFSPARGWTNDPNGLVYYDGEYHLFFQHNPYGTAWGNMTWGHAVSTDLVHWQQLPDAIHLDNLGTIFSGSAVVDQENTTGWQTGRHKPIVCIYTSAGGTNAESQGRPFTQSIAYSIDRGRTWTKHGGNPVLDNIHGGNRDPKVIWHAPSSQWVMVLYLDERGKFGLFGSPDLKKWTKLSDLPFPEGHECPDLFELPVDADPALRRWVAWEGGGRYLVGRFDGKAFTAESGPHLSKFGPNDYAAQTYSDIPASDGRRIQIAWMAGGKYPGMPFNQQMSVPRVLTLRTTPEGIRLFFEPVEELKKLRDKHHGWKDLALGQAPKPLEGIAGDRFDIEATFDLAKAETVGLEIRGQKIEYSAADKQLRALDKAAPLDAVSGKIRLRILVDRTSIEVFANGGRVQMAGCYLPESDNKGLAAYATGGHAAAVALDVWELRSIWKEKENL
ncbi:MAG: glycoside hydrolase family 32 protein [Pirellulales bacterium]|nr:glycoside hydrolase family 32 protein [Pirellulales bacterium]